MSADERTPREPAGKSGSPGITRVLIPKSAPNYAVDAATGDVRVRPRARLLERLPATAGRNAAFDQLHEQLAVATEFFQHHGDGGRYGVYRAMSDIIDYLTSRGIPHATVRPIEAVMAAIVDADIGTASPIFAPTRSRKGGKPTKSVLQQEFDGKKAIVMECCVRHCREKGERPFLEPAAKLAAKMINESSWPVRVTASELIELRERAQQDSKAATLTRKVLDEALSSKVCQSNPLEWAKFLLTHEWVNTLPKVSA